MEWGRTGVANIVDFIYAPLNSPLTSRNQAWSMGWEYGSMEPVKSNSARPRPAGRPRRYARFEEFEAGLPKASGKRPAYCDGIGIYRGARDATVWVKVHLPRGGSYNGRSIPPGGSIEHKLGKGGRHGTGKALSANVTAYRGLQIEGSHWSQMKFRRSPITLSNGWIGRKTRSAALESLRAM